MKYKEIKVFQHSNTVIRVHIPDISDEEREKRMLSIKKATENILKGEKI